MKEWLKTRLARDIGVAHKLWSVQVALLAAVFEGAWVAIPAFQQVLRPMIFAGCCIFLSVAIFIVRLSRQKGLPDE